jgi:hypothetical protein
MVHQLSEDSLTEIHPSLSEMASGSGAKGFLGSDWPAKTSNRKNQVQSPAADFTWVIPLTKSLAGQQ